MDVALAAFVAVAEQRSFTRAAAVLHLTQPAVSQHMRALETRYGVPLVERDRRGIQLTPAGTVLYEHARRILHEYALAQRRLEELTQTPRGPLKIGASFTFGEYVLPHVIAQLTRAYPQVEPHVWIENTHRVAEQVAHSELDVGVVEGPVHHPELVVTPFLRDDMELVLPVGHPLAQAAAVDPQALSQATWLVREPGSGTREIAERTWEEMGIRPAAVLELGSIQVIKESVEAGLGVALLSRWAVRKERTLGVLCCRPLLSHPVQRWFSYVLRAHQFRTKALEVFLTTLCEFNFQHGPDLKV
ncbi:MAG: LysR family transcriptional regulator [Alicyclobacillus sp.]|nr:LysR family transcriptional regulator [Alicyclobacillus sp.]